MYLIECFTQAHIDNITASLRLKPKKLFLLGERDIIESEEDREERGQTIKQRYEKFLKKHSPETKIEILDTTGLDVNDICTVLLPLLQKKEDWVIDLTGGDTMTVMAIGAVLASLDAPTRQRIQVRRQLEDGVINCLNNELRSEPPIILSVKDMITLHGGLQMNTPFQPPKDFTIKDLNPLWDIVADAPALWNDASKYLREFEKRATASSPMVLVLDYIESDLHDFAKKKPIVRALLEKLLDKGIITGQLGQRVWEYSYTHPLYPFFTITPGNVLEVKTLLETKALLAEGKPFFNDCQMGVKIDWDGVQHYDDPKISDTYNEIDVIAVRGTTPLFISCKNGLVEEAEVYKLDTVAKHFGGPYAKKMLVVANMTQKGEKSKRALIQRAWDMDIYVVEDAAKLTRQEWREELLEAMK